MSLDYSLVNVADSNIRHDGDKLQSIAFNMMFVGVRELSTVADCEKFYTRYVAKNTVDNTACKTDGTTYLQWEDVMAFKGITTNVSTFTDAAFKKMLINALMGNAWQSFLDQRLTYNQAMATPIDPRDED